VGEIYNLCKKHGFELGGCMTIHATLEKYNADGTATLRNPESRGVIAAGTAIVDAAKLRAANIAEGARFTTVGDAKPDAIPYGMEGMEISPATGETEKELVKGDIFRILYDYPRLEVTDLAMMMPHASLAEIDEALTALVDKGEVRVVTCYRLAAK
jgi:hypothetical protein